MDGAIPVLGQDPYEGGIFRKVGEGNFVLLTGLLWEDRLVVAEAGLASLNRVLGDLLSLGVVPIEGLVGAKVQVPVGRVENRPAAEAEHGPGGRLVGRIGIAVVVVAGEGSAASVRIKAEYTGGRIAELYLHGEVVGAIPGKSGGQGDGAPVVGGERAHV